MTTFVNPDGNLRKTIRNKTFVLDKKLVQIRTYTRSSISHEVTLSKTEDFNNLGYAETVFRFKR